nr:hypothetical protein GCM10017745_53150 [Saccharothrix mutabilis subsp. capreolus]
MLAATATGVGGFGALLAFSLATRRSTRDLPGLWTYRSATWGDGLLLPVCCGALVLARAGLPPVERERLIGGAAAALGAAGGAATQVLWLLDDAPRLNWTLPRPHRFNAAGAYHAVYLVTMSAAFAGLWASVIARAVAAAPGRVDWRAVGPLVGVALASGGGFAALVLLDNQVSADTRAGRVTIAAVSASAAGLLADAALAHVRQRRKNLAFRG